MPGVNRKAVKRFFEWTPPRWPGKLGLLLVVLGGLAAGLPFVVASGVLGQDGQNQAQRGLDKVFAVVGGLPVYWAMAAAAVLLGVVLIVRFLLMRPKVPSKLYAALLDAKQQDLGGVMERSFRKIGIDIDDLLDFDAEDLSDLTLKSPSGSGEATLETLRRKSVLLFGPSEPYDYGRPIIANKRLLFECSPVLVWILYLTRDQLLTYNALVDITRGDLDHEAVDRIFLRNVVQIGTNTRSKRLKEIADKYLFQQFKLTRGYKPKEIVERQHTITVTMTDGRAKELPLGAREIEDGDKERLGQASEDDDDRYARVAQQIWTRINETK